MITSMHVAASSFKREKKRARGSESESERARE
jgi:hypothetical protein